MNFYSKNFTFSFSIILLSILSSCASYTPQYGTEFKQSNYTKKNDVPLHQLFLIGDAGNSNEFHGKRTLDSLKSHIQKSQSTNHLIFLGDNIYPLGMPAENHPKRSIAEQKLDHQIALSADVNGKTLFIAGNHDWYNGLDGLMEQKKYVESRLGKRSFLPQKYEPIEELKLDDHTTIIAIDSEWFIQNWDRYPDINEATQIRTREDFFEEFRRIVNKNQNNITLVMIHHPMLTNGSHGGYFSARQHLFPFRNIPLPIVGSAINYLRKTSGISPADISHTYYQNLINRLTTICAYQEQVIFISGHEHNLQYIEDNGIKQIVSGSASKIEEVRSVQPSSFSAGVYGYAVLNIYKDRTVEVKYIDINKPESPLFTKTIQSNKEEISDFEEVENTTTFASVYDKKATEKSAFYRFLWGEHYRSLYGKSIEVESLNLKTIHGGLTPIISGGGNQSKSLRMINSQKEQFVMRGVKKSSPQFLQTALFKDTFIKNRLDNTYLIDFIDDFYTTGHPFTPFIVGKLSKPLALYHTNPQLFYIPKQPALLHYNESYGDELYMLEERPHKSQKNNVSFGQPDDIIGTNEMIFNLMKDEKYKVDKQMCLRARLFDILIGDWDRHADQWRWSEFKNENEVTYQPIPRDRDQAFAHIDGFLLSLIKKLPPMRHMQSFEKKFANPRWINKTAFPLDRLLLQNTTVEDWKSTATSIVELMTDEHIEEVFKNLPKEVQDESMLRIIETLKFRRDALLDYVPNYYNKLFQYGLVVGTNKKDHFKIQTNKKTVTIQHIRNKRSGDELQNEYHYDANITKEIFIYGLDDDDVFETVGDCSGITLRIIGGRNNDEFRTQSRTKTLLYDYKSKKNTFNEVKKGRMILRDQFDLNNFDYREAPISTFSLLPGIGYHPDSGLMVGINASLKNQNFQFTPWKHHHQLKARFDAATNGFSTQYNFTVKDYSAKGYFHIDALITNSRFAQNFFGWGNQSQNREDQLTIDYHRVRTSQFEFNPSYEWKGRNGSSLMFGATYQAIKIENTDNRLIDEMIENNEDSYSTHQFGGLKAQYSFTNYDKTSNPSIGFGFKIAYHFRANLENTTQQSQAWHTKISFMVPIDNMKRWTFSSQAEYNSISGDYHFYQAPSMGVNNGLRGYRHHRFVGNKSLIISNDLRWNINQLKNSIVLMNYGIYGGYDLGRVYGFDSRNYWHQSYGGGLWLSVLDAVSAQIGLFHSNESNLINFGLGYQF